MRAPLLPLLCAGALACAPPSPVSPVPVPVPVPALVSPAPPAVEAAITSAVARDEPTWPRPPEAEPPRATSLPERHLPHRICSGYPGPKERPHTAACCYPAKDLLVAPLRSLFPRLRACYDARTKTDARGSVAFTFRIEQDGAIAHACASEASTMDDEPAAMCMIEALRTLRYPAQSDADVAFCGLVTITYPVAFEP